MAAKRDRFFALFGALLFLTTASALTIAVIWSAVASKDTPTTTTSSTTCDSSATKATASAGKLQGTKLGNYTPSGSAITTLQEKDLTAGTGDAVKSGDTIQVDYTGALACDGTIFQSSLDSGQKFTVVIGKGNVIPGWDTGIIGMQVGGTRRLSIPAAEAYGAQAQSGIPANSDLIFDVTLYKIGQ